MPDFLTAFSYKDERSYIHSSTMCAFLGENVVPALGLQAVDVQIDAQFYRVATRNGVMRCQDAPSDMRSNPTVAAEFRLVSDSGIFYVYFIEGEDQIVTRVDTKYEISDLVLEAPFSGFCRIGAANLLSMFENIIEANKRLHMATLHDNTMKVINLYMKKFPLGSLYAQKGILSLSVRHIGSRTHNDGIATINEFSFGELNISPFQMCYFIPGVAL